MRGKSILVQIPVLKQLLEKSYDFNQDLFLLFIDYKQAYYSITRESLWSIVKIWNTREIG